MKETKKAQDHLEVAKDEIKSAAGAIVHDTKEKAHDVLESVTDSIVNAAEKVHAEVTKTDPVKK